MKNAVKLLATAALALLIFGCSDSPNEPKLDRMPPVAAGGLDLDIAMGAIVTLDGALRVRRA
jgi:hypothetical protein